MWWKRVREPGNGVTSIWEPTLKILFGIPTSTLGVRGRAGITRKEGRGLESVSNEEEEEVKWSSSNFLAPKMENSTSKRRWYGEDPKRKGEGLLEEKTHIPRFDSLEMWWRERDERKAKLVGRIEGKGWRVRECSTSVDVGGQRESRRSRQWENPPFGRWRRKRNLWRKRQIWIWKSKVIKNQSGHCSKSRRSLSSSSFPTSPSNLVKLRKKDFEKLKLEKKSGRTRKVEERTLWLKGLQGLEIGQGS